MSLIYAEGFDRHPLNVAIANGAGASGKAIDVRVFATNVAALPAMSIQTVMGRNWLCGFGGSVNTSNNTPWYIHIGHYNDPTTITDTRNPARLPPAGDAARMIFQWKLSWGGPTKSSPSNHPTVSGIAYLGQFNGQDLAVSYAGNGKQSNDLGYFQVEIIFEPATGYTRLFVDGVNRVNYTLSATKTPALKINLAGLGMGSSAVGFISLENYVSDIIVIYDDGIYPSVPLGDVSVRDLVMEAVTPTHPDAVFSEVSNIHTSKLNSKAEALKLVGDGTNVVYKPSDAQPALGDGLISAIVVDTSRGVGVAPGDLETKVQTANGNSLRRESPVTFNINLQSTIRNLSRGTSLQAVKDNARVTLTNRAR